MNQRIGLRLKALRLAQDLTLDGLASASGVSRAMISRIERAETSATAALLARLCASLGLSLSVLFEEQQAETTPVTRRADQPVWRDPESGYLRRAVSARTVGGIDLVEVEFPAGARVVLQPPQSERSFDQHVWVLEGVVEMLVDGQTHRLEAGDYLTMTVAAVHAFHNPGSEPARYAVIIERNRRSSSLS